MEAIVKNVYLLCATIGGTVLLIQTLLLVFAGHGADGDVHLDADLHDGDLSHGDTSHGGPEAHDAGDFLKMLSLKTVVAFLTFFGLAGLASAQGGFSPASTLVVALGAGSVAFYMVAYLVVCLSRLQSKGNLDPRNAVGETGQVYLRVPGQRSGQGKVLVEFQGRKVDMKAVTAGGEIPSGSPVRVVALSSKDTVEVLPLGKEKINA
jgi:hypothetical protein